MRANAAWLAGGFMILRKGATPDAAWKPFEQLKPHPFVPFRDATQAWSGIGGVGTLQFENMPCTQNVLLGPFPRQALR
jgi:hypothetical protein